MLWFGFQSPKRFEELFEEMISFLEHTEHWENTELELATRGVRVLLSLQHHVGLLLFDHKMLPTGVDSLSSFFFFFQSITFYSHPRQVKHLNFYDIVLDFILMDSFEDLENPPISIQNVINNRWLNSSFKETVSERIKYFFILNGLLAAGVEENQTWTFFIMYYLNDYTTITCNSEN